MNGGYNDDVFGPRNVKISDIGIQSLGALISGIIGSFILIMIVFAVSGIIDIPNDLKNMTPGIGASNPLFPIILSFVTLITTIIVSLVSYKFLTMTDSEKFKKSSVHLGNILFFSLFIYIFIAPIYIYLGMMEYNLIIIVFIIHILIASFGQILILEILNNYRYVLLGVYASFMGLITTGILISLVFSLFSSSYAKLVSLLLILPLCWGLMTFFKGFFEILYYKYHKITGYDPLGDVFRQIEIEEKNEFEQIVNENSI